MCVVLIIIHLLESHNVLCSKNPGEVYTYILSCTNATFKMTEMWECTKLILSFNVLNKSETKINHVRFCSPLMC